jgi:hypothetical protein
MIEPPWFRGACLGQAADCGHGGAIAAVGTMSK